MMRAMSEDNEGATLVGGQRLYSVHDRTACAGRACTIHNPSAHHMSEWSQNFREDRYLMERICPHGVGHPDPDDPNPDTVHGCDGCCSTKPERRRLRVVMTRTMWVDVDADVAERCLSDHDDCHAGCTRSHPDLTDLSDRVARWHRAAAYGHEYIESDLTVEDGTGDQPWYCEPLDGDTPEKYLWSARHFVIEARYHLASGRYREGRCPELDAVNGDLARIEDRLRLMALEVDHPNMPEVREWRDAE